MQYITPVCFPTLPVARQLKLDPNSAHCEIQLTYNDTKAQLVRHHQSYADHPDRFDCSLQLLCTAAVCPRCYWEVEWRGLVEVGVAYYCIQRKGSEADSSLGRNAASWTLSCSAAGFSAWHDNKMTFVPLTTPFTSIYNTVAVFLDTPTGILSFYRLNSGSLLHLHTFSAAFNEPLYAAFRLLPHSSIYLRSPFSDVSQ